jgi:hypothetical protein
MININKYSIDAISRNQSTTELVIKKNLTIFDRISALAVAIITKIASLFSNRIDPKVAAEAWAQCYEGNRFILKTTTPATLTPAEAVTETAIVVFNPRGTSTGQSFSSLTTRRFFSLIANHAIAMYLEYERALARSTRAYAGRADMSLAMTRSTSLTPEAVKRILCLLYLQKIQATRDVSVVSMGTSQQLLLENG